MKPLQIGLLVLVGALGGAVIMKFTQRPKPVPVAVAPPAPAAVTPPAVTPAPVPAVAPVPEPVMKAEPAEMAPPVKRAKPARTQETSVVAQNLPPAQPEQPAPAPPPPPAPVQEQVSAPPPVETTPATQAAEPPASQPAPSVTLQSGMSLPVRLGENLSSEHNMAGDTFTATLDAPVTAGGFVIAEKGARVEGRVVEAQKSGHGKKALLTLELTKLNTSDGQHVEIKTEAFRKQGSTMATGDQVGVVAAAAGIGAIIGAMAGGGKGAAIGAGAGGAAGGGGVVATRDKAINLPTESKVTFRLSTPVTLTEQVNR